MGWRPDDPCLTRANELRLALHTRAGMSFRQADLLRDYRQWLDMHNITAELDGWPSAEAYEEWNIAEFIKDVEAIHMLELRTEASDA